MAGARFSDTVPHTFIQAWHDGSLRFLLGAFASSASCLPSADELTRSILTELLAQAHPDLSRTEHAQITRLLTDAKGLLSDEFVKSIRLEALLGAIESEDVSRYPPGENHYIAMVARMIGEGAVPHLLHQLLHEGLRCGKIPAVFTTNWDCLIENADPGLADASIAWDETTFGMHVGSRHTTGSHGLLGKLHGTADQPGDDPAVRDQKARSLVHDLLGLGGPLAPHARLVFESHIRDQPFLVLGYSGLDPDIHVSLREAQGPICWVVHPDRTKGRADGERIAQRLPHALSDSVFVFGIEAALQQMFGLEFHRQSRPLSLTDAFKDIDAPRALVAIGLALEHGGHGQAADRILNIASRLPDARYDLAVQQHRWSQHATMYGGIFSIRHLRRLLRQTDAEADPARYHELMHYRELAIENCLRGSMFRLLNAWIGRPLAARFLRRHVDFDNLAALVEATQAGATQQQYARIVAVFVNLTLSSVRVWRTEPLDQKHDRLETCLRHATACRAFGLQGNVLRYLGRLAGIMGNQSLAEKHYAAAEERFEAITSAVGVAEVAKYHFKTALSFGTEGPKDAEKLAVDYMGRRGIRLEYIRVLHWAAAIERWIPVIGRPLSKRLLRLLRAHLRSPAGF